jgi:competence protein ComEA
MGSVITWALAAMVAAAPAVHEGSRTEAAEKALLILDLNHATAEELTQLPGIGPKRAEAIVARRNERPYTRVTQLLEVKGIGKRTLERLRPHLRLVPVVSLQPAVPVASAEDRPKT